MKRRGILNARLAGLIAGMGHTDALVVADVGLPVPPGVTLVDLAVVEGLPGFADVLKAILTELQVERCVMADEAAETLRAQAPCPPELVSHEAFKTLTAGAKVIVRTGETTPYANIALYSGVTF